MISVIIPVYNDPEGLRDTLENLVNQDFKGEYEVLPVDNNSSDSTGGVIEEFEDEYSVVKGLEENEIQSSYAARNKGIEESEGDILVFTDADMWWDKDVLSIVSREFEETDVDYLGGRVNSVDSEDSILSEYSRGSFGDEERTLEEGNYVRTAFLAIRKVVAEDVGGFDSRMMTGGDKVLGKKVFRSGFQQRFSCDVQTYHPTRNSLEDLIERKARWEGINYYQLKKFHPELLDKDRHPLSPLNFFPALPWRASNIVDGWDSYGLRRKIGFYLVYWVLKLSKPYGYLKAWKRDKF